MFAPFLEGLGLVPGHHRRNTFGVVETSDVRGDERGHCHETHDIGLGTPGNVTALRVLEAWVPHDAVRLVLGAQDEQLLEVPLLLLPGERLHVCVVVVGGRGL